MMPLENVLRTVIRVAVVMAPALLLESTFAQGISATLLTTFTNLTPAASDGFGSSVAAVGGDRVLIGAFFDDAGATKAGAAYLFRTSGKLIDARVLPLEKPADENGPEAASARAALQATFEKIQPDGPRPPMPFSNAAK